MILRSSFRHEEWMTECDEIDDWIDKHREFLTQWLYYYLIDNEELFLGL